MMLLFLLLFCLRTLPLKCGQNQVSNRLIFAFVVAVVIVVVVVVVVIDPKNLPLKFG